MNFLSHFKVHAGTFLKLNCDVYPNTFDLLGNYFMDYWVIINNYLMESSIIFTPYGFYQRSLFEEIFFEVIFVFIWLSRSDHTV